MLEYDIKKWVERLSTCYRELGSGNMGRNSENKEQERSQSDGTAFGDSKQEFEEFHGMKKRKTNPGSPTGPTPPDTPPRRISTDHTPSSRDTNNSLGTLEEICKHPHFQQAGKTIRTKLAPILMDMVNNVKSGEPSVKAGLEAAAAIKLMELFHPGMNGIGKLTCDATLQLAKGEEMQREGEKMVNHSKEKLKTAIYQAVKLISRL